MISQYEIEIELKYVEGINRVFFYVKNSVNKDSMNELSRDVFEENNFKMTKMQ